MSLPRVRHSARESRLWLEPSAGQTTHVVVPVESVVTRECGLCGGSGKHRRYTESDDGLVEVVDMVDCPECGGSGTFEAVHYEPDPEWLRVQIVRLLGGSTGRIYGEYPTFLADRIMALLGMEGGSE